MGIFGRENDKLKQQNVGLCYILSHVNDLAYIWRIITVYSAEWSAP